MIQTIDSDRRCPRCSKRMFMDIGQDDQTGAGDMRAEHVCWSCDHREMDRAWSKPLGTDPVRGWLSRGERLRQLRLEGTVIPIQYDDEPWPVSEFDEEEVDA